MDNADKMNKIAEAISYIDDGHPDWFWGYGGFFTYVDGKMVPMTDEDADRIAKIALEVAEKHFQQEDF